MRILGLKQLFPTKGFGRPSETDAGEPCVGPWVDRVPTPDAFRDPLALAPLVPVRGLGPVSRSAKATGRKCGSVSAAPWRWIASPGVAARSRRALSGGARAREPDSPARARAFVDTSVLSTTFPLGDSEFARRVGDPWQIGTRCCRRGCCAGLASRSRAAPSLASRSRPSRQPVAQVAGSMLPGAAIHLALGCARAEPVCAGCKLRRHAECGSAPRSLGFRMSELAVQAVGMARPVARVRRCLRLPAHAGSRCS